jgi:hypothetical protein
MSVPDSSVTSPAKAISNVHNLHKACQYRLLAMVSFTQHTFVRMQSLLV